MLTVGLTGGLASGKSFAAAEFERLGCRVLRADEIGRSLLRDNPEVRDEIIGAFGPGVAPAGGRIDRRALAGVVFASPEKLERLNRIVHPRVFRRIDDFFEGIRSSVPSAVALVEAAIMIETGSYRRYDRIVLAACPREVQVGRFVARGSGSRTDAEARLCRQMPLEEKRRYAHHVIDTGGSKAETLSQVGALYRRLRQMAVSESTR